MSAVAGYEDLKAACNGWMQFYEQANQSDREHKLLEDDHELAKRRVEALNTLVAEQGNLDKLSRRLIRGLCVATAALALGLIAALLL